MKNVSMDILSDNDSGIEYEKWWLIRGEEFMKQSRPNTPPFDEFVK